MTSIKILGTGCPKCTQLAENARAAADRLGLECEIEKVGELNEIMGYGVMMTPALVVDDAVRAAGRVPSVEQIEELLRLAPPDAERSETK